MNVGSRKGAPFLGKPFSVKKTVERHAAVIKILSRAGKRVARAGNQQIADAYRRLRAKLSACRPRRRCGSSACPKCARAFSPGVCDHRPATHDLPVTGQFSQIDVLKANRWLKDVLDRHGIRRVIIGSIDLGWEMGRPDHTKFANAFGSCSPRVIIAASFFCVSVESFSAVGCQVREIEHVNIERCAATTALRRKRR